MLQYLPPYTKLSVYRSLFGWCGEAHGLAARPATNRVRDNLHTLEVKHYMYISSELARADVVVSAVVVSRVVEYNLN